MRDRYSQIGIDRLIRLSWLEKVAALTVSGNSSAEIKHILQNDLKSSFRSGRTDVRGSLDKTITILMKLWTKPPKELALLQKNGLELIKYCPKNKHLAIHWGMMMAMYPFWASVATQVGRLLALQGTASANHVQRRLREQYGERETVSRRTRYVLRSFVDWRVLKETDSSGVYASGVGMPVKDTAIAVWLIETSLHAQPNGSAPLRDTMDSPRLFPFSLSAVQVEPLLKTSDRIDIIRHGLDDTLVILKNTP